MAEFMDRALKERTVGAVVLVVLAVLVVPVFLDGSAEDAEVVTAAVTLPGQNEQPRKQQTIVLNRDRTEPVPAADRPTTTQRAAARAPAVAEAADTGQRPSPADSAPAADASDDAKRRVARAADATRDKADATAAAESATGMWAVQLGSFSKSGNAERLAADLRGKGYAAFLSKLQNSGSELHRVRIGPQKDRDSAEAVAARLAADGHKGQVVPHP